ncbi:DEAD/DEAH box helicase [uncultured Duncaniella sp.]|uniref:DEAD/DEAH box helicase n=1 Tax=uncultured Duncaniella sp. TaxID=2768039 RepID=UPI00262A4CB3|nr:DEAD/DEAH box helicase [uncultured Duncaniella sp.]
MTNLVEVQYAQTGRSSNTDELGMREMQAMVYAQRNRQYLLVKAPPASGKSRAMMFVALDKLANQGVKKVIVAVPQQNIGRSFKDTALKEFGFFEDWRVAPYWNLCLNAGSENSKKSIVREFLDSPSATKLVCTHATLLNSLNGIDARKLDNVFFGIDEFHHGSADEDNRLGTLIRRLLNETSAHILAMTGSYFRGDAVPVMRPEDEAKFQPTINYNYYQQLNGYRWLKSLGIGYSFFQGNYLTAIPDVLDTTKKTLIHIPHPNSKTGAFMNKHDQVEEIIKCIGEVLSRDYNNNLYKVKTADGRILSVGDLVEDKSEQRALLQSYLHSMNSRDSLDILIALGTAKEGFDWEWCEHCITIGIRASLTEVVQIIGRCTRDCAGKTHAQFTNLIPCPDAAQDDVAMAVNDFLKAISASLLMEQVMAPKWNFKTKPDEDEPEQRTTQGEDDHVIEVMGLPALNDRTRAIVENDLDTLVATTLGDRNIREAIIGEGMAEMITNVYIPKIIRETYPNLTEEEVDAVAQHTILTIATQGENITVDDSGNRLLRIAGQFDVNINRLNINLIHDINPFQRAYEVVSKSITAELLRKVQYAIDEQREGKMSLEEATYWMYNYLPRWREENPGKLAPELTDGNPYARNIARAIQVVRNYKIQLQKKDNV